MLFSLLNHLNNETGISSFKRLGLKATFHIMPIQALLSPGELTG